MELHISNYTLTPLGVPRTCAKILSAWWERSRTWGVANVVGAVIVSLVLYSLIAPTSKFARTLLLYRWRYIVALGLLSLALALIAAIVMRGNRRLNRILTITLFLGALLAEWGVGYVVPLGSLQRIARRNVAPYVMFTLSPNTTTEDAAAGRMSAGALDNTYIQTNALGYRGPLPPLPKPDGEYRILMIGGSTTVLGSPIENTIVCQLERLFHERGRTDVRVYNWGVYSAGSGEELATIVHRAPGYEPDLVLVYDGANDVYGRLMGDPRPGYPYNFAAVEFGARVLNGDIGLVETLGLLAQRSALVDRLLDHAIAVKLTRLEPLRREVGYGTPSWRQAIADRYSENVRRIAAVGPALGFKTVVVFQPIRALHRVTLPSATPPSHEDRMAADIYDRMGKALQGRGFTGDGMQFREVDLSHALLGHDESVFWDVVHVDNNGNRTMAEMFYRELEEFAVHARTGAGQDAATGASEGRDRPIPDPWAPAHGHRRPGCADRPRSIGGPHPTDEGRDRSAIDARGNHTMRS